jgi:hypothetical protein
MGSVSDIGVYASALVSPSFTVSLGVINAFRKCYGMFIFIPKNDEFYFVNRARRLFSNIEFKEILRLTLRTESGIGNCVRLMLLKK